MQALMHACFKFEFGIGPPSKGIRITTAFHIAESVLSYLDQSRLKYTVLVHRSIHLQKSFMMERFLVRKDNSNKRAPEETVSPNSTASAVPNEAPTPVFSPLGNDNNCMTKAESAQNSKKKGKRFFPWKLDLLIKYKWLVKETDGKVFCKFCTKFPEKANKGHELFKGWYGNEEGFKEEMFSRHHHNKFHKECEAEFNKLCLDHSKPIIPEVKSWANKLSNKVNAELCTKFVASNFLATENISNLKIWLTAEKLPRRCFLFHFHGLQACPIQDSVPILITQLKLILMTSYIGS